MLHRGTPARGAEPYIPAGPVSLPLLRDASQACRGCDLYQRATQAVFGEGPTGAAIMLVGEQPGDEEDRQGRPFVGPAGRLLDRAMRDAGMERTQTYVTNAVKHFRWIPAPRGKRRMHSKPLARHVNACRPWLEAEIGLIKPRVIVLLGATAAQSLMGPSFRVLRERGRVIRNSPRAPAVVATVHPSSVLRAGDDREEAYAALVEDLRVAARAAYAAPGARVTRRTPGRDQNQRAGAPRRRPSLVSDRRRGALMKPFRPGERSI